MNLRKIFGPKAAFLACAAIGVGGGWAIGELASESLEWRNQQAALSEGGIVIETRGEADGLEACKQNVGDLIDALPPSFIEPIRDHGIFVRITDENPRGVENYNETMRRVTLNFDPQTGSCSDPYVVIHEFGHAFDEAEGFRSNSLAFRSAIDTFVESDRAQASWRDAGPVGQAFILVYAGGDIKGLLRSEFYAYSIACQLSADQPSHYRSVAPDGFCKDPQYQVIHTLVRRDLGLE